jgi:hypothetical protein
MLQIQVRGGFRQTLGFTIVGRFGAARVDGTKAAMPRARIP